MTKSHIPGDNIFELYNILTRQVKRNLTSSIKDLVDQLPSDLPHDLRLKILGNEWRYNLVPCLSSKN